MLHQATCCVLRQRQPSTIALRSLMTWMTCERQTSIFLPSMSAAATFQSQVLALGSLMTPGCLAYQSSRRPMLGWITLTPAWAAAIACTRLHPHREVLLSLSFHVSSNAPLALCGWWTTRAGSLFWAASRLRQPGPLQLPAQGCTPTEKVLSLSFMLLALRHWLFVLGISIVQAAYVGLHQAGASPGRCNWLAQGCIRTEITPQPFVHVSSTAPLLLCG